uniref:HERV-H LTR-associating 2b, tandem duplicate 1 n=1 Tax=Hucho hucho TaxID=62062 RepID=A0A4W5MTU9_9TELE
MTPSILPKLWQNDLRTTKSRYWSGHHKVYVNLRLQLCVCIYIIWCVAPIRALSLELSRLSGYEELKCTTQHVYPAPHVAWATDPPTTQPLRPITRKLADRQGLYAVESRLRRLNSRSELTYICTVNSSYGSQTWTASLREREINGVEGKDLTIPCHAPPYQPKSSLYWSFTNHNEEVLILTYDSQSQLSSASAPWEACARLDVLRVPLGDGSLQLVNPVSLEHTGTYTCVYSSPQNTHTEHTGVNISAVTGERKSNKSNQIVFVTCAEYNRCRPYSEMLTHKPLTNNAVKKEKKKMLSMVQL